MQRVRLAARPQNLNIEYFSLISMEYFFVFGVHQCALWPAVWRLLPEDDILTSAIALQVPEMEAFRTVFHDQGSPQIVNRFPLPFFFSISFYFPAFFSYFVEAHVFGNCQKITKIKIFNEQIFLSDSSRVFHLHLKPLSLSDPTDSFPRVFFSNEYLRTINTCAFLRVIQ